MTPEGRQRQASMMPDASTANGVNITPVALLRYFTFKTPNVNIFRRRRSHLLEIGISDYITCRHLVIPIVTHDLTYRVSFRR